MKRMHACLSYYLPPYLFLPTAVSVRMLSVFRTMKRAVTTINGSGSAAYHGLSDRIRIASFNIEIFGTTNRSGQCL